MGQSAWTLHNAVDVAEGEHQSRLFRFYNRAETAFAEDVAGRSAL